MENKKENGKIGKTQLERLLKLTREIFISQVVDGMVEDGFYNIPNFGKFKITKRKGQVIKNPLGNFTLPDTYVIRFTPSKTLKKRIKEKLKMKQGGPNG
jgi:nucleoid DNA-binding protein